MGSAVMAWAPLPGPFALESPAPLVLKPSTKAYHFGFCFVNADLAGLKANQETAFLPSSLKGRELIVLHQALAGTLHR